MKKICKFEIQPGSLKDSQQVIEIMAPVGLVPRSIMVQGASVYLWGEVEIGSPESDHLPKVGPFRLLCIGTGHGAVPKDADYFCSLIHNGYVWHFYLPRNGHAPGKEKTDAVG